jgi:hypothetical protein
MYLLILVKYFQIAMQSPLFEEKIWFLQPQPSMVEMAPKDFRMEE